MALPTLLALSSCVIRADDVHPVVLVPHHPLVHVDDVVRVGDLEAGGGDVVSYNYVGGHGSDGHGGTTDNDGGGTSDNDDNGDNYLSHGVCCVPIEICHSRGATSVRPG